MKCSDVRQRFSLIYDKELSPEETAQALAHISDCPSCEKQLASYGDISNLAQQLVSPSIPDHLWDEIQARLDVPGTERSDVEKSKAGEFSLAKPAESQLPIGWLALAASLLIAIGIGTVMFRGEGIYKHDHLAVDFSRYLNEFSEQPEAAQQILLTNYEGRSLSLSEAEEALGYAPVVTEGLPPGYSLCEVHLLDMPCCTCSQVLCKDEAGHSVAIFEHAIDQPIWFGNRPTKECLCHQVPTSVKQIGDRLAATWKEGSRYVTIIGVSDMDEVSAFVEQFRANNSG